MNDLQEILKEVERMLLTVKELEARCVLYYLRGYIRSQIDNYIDGL